MSGRERRVQKRVRGRSRSQKAKPVASSSSRSRSSLPRRPGKRPEWSAGRGEVGDRDLMAILLQEVEIDTGHFRSKDFSSRREGLLTLDVSGQHTAIPFHDGKDGIVIDRPGLVFLGRNPGRLAMSINLMESDQEIRDLLDDVGGFLEKVGTSPASSFHPAVAPGTRLLSGIIGMIRSHVDDDQEYQFFAVYDQPFNHSSILRLEGKNGAGKTVLKLKLKIVNLGEISISNNLSFRLDGLQIDWEPSASLDAGHLRRPWVGREMNRSGRIPARQWRRDFGMDWLSLEAASRSAEFACSVRLDDAREGVDWHEAELLLAKAGRGTRLADRHLVPMSLGVRLAPKELKPEAILGLVPDAFDTASALGLDAGDLEKSFTKLEPLAVRLLQQLHPGSISLFDFDGLVFLDPDDSEHPEDLPRWVDEREKDVLVMAFDRKEKAWVRPVKSDIRIHGQKVGTFQARLRVVEVGKILKS